MRMQSLQGAMKDRNRSLTELSLQQLRNCLMVFGAGPVSFTAEALEAAVRGGPTRQVQREWKLLDRQLQLLVPQVQRLMLEMATPKSAVQ